MHYILSLNFLDLVHRFLEYIDIYQKLCGIYEKDMILCYCLLLLKERGVRTSYEESHPDSRSIQDRINYVKRRINSFGEVYDRNIRNAVTHIDIETDSDKRIFTIYTGSKKQSKSYSFDSFIPYCTHSFYFSQK